MDLREIIESASKKANGQKALALLIGVNPVDLAQAKAGRRKLPEFACVNLANYIGIEPMTAIAASALVTEKNEERRKVFYPFVIGRAAMLCAFVLSVSATALPPESHAAQAPMTTAYSQNWHYDNI